MNVLWLGRKDELYREFNSYVTALKRAGANPILLDPDAPPDVDIRRLVEKCPEAPALVIHPEPFTAVLPRGLEEVEIPTVGFQVDVYAYTHRRLTYSMLFDYVAILHPGFEDVFRRAGHPSPITMPFAADQYEFFDSGEERIYEVSSVGHLHPHRYSTRIQVLSELSREFKMNEWHRYHNREEIPPVYRASKIVINVPRDDFPTDVSMRFAEAMACGALFLTRTPSEMTALGFEENVHFVGYRDPTDVPAIVRRCLANECERVQIAQAGREKVLREHTFDARIAQLLALAKNDNPKFRAPARSWTPSRVRLAYLDYFAANGLFDCAKDDLLAILKSASPESWKALKLFSRSKASRVINYLRFRGTSFWPAPSKT
jgi:hypothetical protein